MKKAVHIFTTNTHTIKIFGLTYFRWLAVNEHLWSHVWHIILLVFGAQTWIWRFLVPIVTPKLVVCFIPKKSSLFVELRWPNRMENLDSVHLVWWHRDNVAEVILKYFLSNTWTVSNLSPRSYLSSDGSHRRSWALALDEYDFIVPEGFNFIVEGPSSAQSFTILSGAARQHTCSPMQLGPCSDRHFSYSRRFLHPCSR